MNMDLHPSHEFMFNHDSIGDPEEFSKYFAGTVSNMSHERYEEQRKAMYAIADAQIVKVRNLERTGKYKTPRWESEFAKHCRMVVALDMPEFHLWVYYSTWLLCEMVKKDPSKKSKALETIHDMANANKAEWRLKWWREAYKLVKAL